MKKLLALVLALVMSMSLVTISNAAFKDADKIDYDEAVEVMNAIGVLVGDEKGNFNAKDNLTREQAAKIISYLLLGNKTAAALVGAAKFTDVAATRWSAGFVDYCASTGVVAGNGDGTFAPAGQLTGFQFAKMLLVALGYDAKIEGFTGTDWQINVSKVANQVGLFNGLSISGTAALTREQAAQMCLNTLKAPLVQYSNKGGNISVNGAVIEIGASKAEYVTTTLAKEQRISGRTLTNTTAVNGGYTVEFGEKYYSKLVLKHDKTDDFGRPAHTWLYDNKEIGTYVEYDLLVEEYTTKVTGKDLYDLLGSTAIKDSDVNIYVDGVSEKADLETAGVYFSAGNLVKTNTKGVGGTEKGVLTQVFQNTDKDKIDIVIINTYLAKAVEDYDEKDEEVDVKIFALDETSGKNSFLYKNKGQYVSKTVENDDINVESVKKDDLFLVTVAAGKVQTMVAPEIIANATVSSFKLDKWVKADGTQYDYANTAQYDDEVLNKYDKKNMKDTTYNVILDQYGYMIGIEKNEDADEYLFMTGIDDNYSNLYTKTSDANVIFLDGTMKTVKVDNKDSKFGFDYDKTGNLTTVTSQVNQWYTYTTDKDGVYTLTVVEKADATKNEDAFQRAQDVDAGDELEISKKRISLCAITGAAYGNDDSVYINVTLKDLKTAASDGQNEYKFRVIDDVDSVVTGIKNVKITVKNAADKSGYKAPANEIYTLYNDKNWVIAAVVIGEDDGISTNYAYVTGSVNRESYNSAEDEWTWSLEAVVNGKIVELTEVGDKLKYLDEMDQGKWYEVKYDADGNVRGTKHVDSNDDPAEVPFADKAGKYINNVNLIVDSAKDEDTILLKQQFSAKTDKLTFKKGSLYTSKDLTNGFAVSPDVKVVLSLSALDKNGMITLFDDVTDGYTGYDGLEKAIRNLDNKNNPFKGTVSAIFEYGVATTIVISDETATSVDEGTDSKPGATFDKVTLLDQNNGDLEFTKNGKAAAPKDITVDVYFYNPSAGNSFVCINKGASYTYGESFNVFTAGVSGLYYVVADGVQSNTVNHTVTP